MDELAANGRHGRPRKVTREAILYAVNELGNLTRGQIAFSLGVTPQIIGRRLREYEIILPYDFSGKNINPLRKLPENYMPKKLEELAHEELYVEVKQVDGQEHQQETPSPKAA